MQRMNTIFHASKTPLRFNSASIGRYRMPFITKRFNMKDSKAAADILTGHWQKGTTLDELPENLRPDDSIAGYEIQQHFAKLSDQPIFGWKIAATSAAGQRHINVVRPLAGRILEERVKRCTSVDSPPTIPLGPNRMSVAELEFVFHMGKSLSPRSDGEPHDIGEVMAAVEGLYLGSEMPDSRFTDFTAVGAAQLIADNACGDRFVLGPEVTEDWRSENLAAHIVKGWAVDGAGKERDAHHGSGAEVLSDPRVALTWLVNELNEHNITLEKGQYVTTGTCIIPIPVNPGDTITGDYGTFGKIKVKFSQ